MTAGQRVGSWSLLSIADGGTRWLCVCDCGTQRPVLARSLTAGASRSCGCVTQRMHRRVLSQCFGVRGADRVELTQF